MKRRLQYIGISCVALLMSAVCLVGGILQTKAKEQSQNALDFGIAGVANNQTLAPSELFALIAGEAPTASETAYLDGLSGLTLTYNSTIPDSVVLTDYNGEQGVLNVSLTSYVFTASNGVTVEWIPKRARIGDSAQTFVYSSGAYTCRFDGLFHSADFDMEIDFEWNAEIPADEVDALFTQAYGIAELTLADLKEYEAKLAQYQEAKRKFLAYDAYIKSVEAYRQYSEIDLPAYETAYAEFLVYKEKNSAYFEKLAAYEAWQHYWAYQEFMGEETQKKYLAYQAYLKELAPVQERLQILENLFVSDSRGWQLYGSLMGNTVAQVVANKSKIVAAIPDSDAASYVDTAEASTAVLRKMMSEYAKLRSAKYSSEHARLNALYNFYVQYYSELKKEFGRLYDSLHYLGGKSAVITALAQKGKMEHYYQFVGQLYVTQARLDDDGKSIEEQEKEKQWYIYDSRNTLTAVVEAVHLLSDTTPSDPKGVTMPTDEVPKVEKVEQIDRPTFDEVREEPIPPTPVVEEPTKPAPVEKPDTSNPPDAAEDPGAAPAEPTVDAISRALAEDLRAGRLPEREAPGETRTVTLHKSISTPVSIRNLKTVTFYDSDGETVLYRQSFDFESRIEYKGPYIDYREDHKGYYQFLSWTLSDGVTSPEMIATGNLSLYAKYHFTPRNYTVTWILDGVKRKDYWPYGEIPSYKWSTAKEPDQAYTYTFSGWDKEIVPVTEDVTYTASFIPTLRSYTVTWNVDGRIEQTVLPFGAQPTYEGSLIKEPDDFRYEFIGWDKPPVSVSEDVTYTAEYRAVPLAFDSNGNQLQITYSETAVAVQMTQNRADVRAAATLARDTQRSLVLQWEQFSLSIEGNALDTLLSSYCREIGIGETREDRDAVIYTVGYFNNAGVMLELSIPATVKTCRNDQGLLLSGALQKDGEWETVQDGGTVEGAFTLRVRDVFAIKLTSSEPCNVFKFPKYASCGDVVDLSLIGCEFGYEISKAVLHFADGSSQTLSGSSFMMPEQAVELEITISKIIYRVSFMVDGKVYHTAEYGMGEEIVLPKPPVKSDDELYKYQFTKWSPEVESVAYGDARELIYEAVFDAKLINPKANTDKTLFYRVLFVAIGILVLLVALVVMIVVLSCRRKRRKRALASKKKAGITSTKTESVAQASEVTDPTEETQPQESDTEDREEKQEDMEDENVI